MVLDLDLDSWVTRAQEAYQARMRECHQTPARPPPPISSLETSSRLPTGMVESNSTAPVDSPPPPGGRGKRLTPSEQRALVRICAERMDNPDSTAYPKSFWIWVSNRFLETTNRSYSWQSCRRSIGRLVMDRQEYWDAVDEDLSCHNHMESVLAAEVDQWMGVCLRSHEQLKTPEDMLQRRLRKPPTRLPSVDGETEAQVREKRQRVLNWVCLLPDDSNSSIENHQQEADDSAMNPVQVPDSRHWPAGRTADNPGSKLRRMKPSEPSYISSMEESTGDLNEQERTGLSGRKRLRQDEDDYEDTIAPPPKYIRRPGALKEREAIGQGSRVAVAHKPSEGIRGQHISSQLTDPLTVATNRVVDRAVDATVKVFVDHLRPYGYGEAGDPKGRHDLDSPKERFYNIMFDFVTGISQAVVQFGNGNNSPMVTALANMPRHNKA